MGNSNDHWIPQSYLRRWKDSDQKIQVLRRENGRELSSRCSTKGVLSENHLYSVYGADSSLVIHGETEVFSGIDNAVAEPMRYLADGDWKKMPQQLAEPFYRFLYTLAPRSRAMIELFAKDAPALAQSLAHDLEAKGFAGAAEVGDAVRAAFGSARDLSVYLVLGIVRYSQYWRTYFDNIPMYVYELPNDDAEFFTSDVPLMTYPAIDADDALHILPLSRRRCLVACYDVVKLETICAQPPSRFASLVNIRLLSKAATAIAFDDRYRADIFRYLGCETDRERLIASLNDAALGTVRCGARAEIPELRPRTVRAQPSLGPFHDAQAAFRAGILGMPYAPSSPLLHIERSAGIGACESLIRTTTQWYLDEHDQREAYRLGRGLAYVFFQMDQWDQPRQDAESLRKALRAHSLEHQRNVRQNRTSRPYGVEVILTKIRQLCEKGLRQIYADPADHAREVLLYVKAGF